MNDWMLDLQLKHLQKPTKEIHLFTSKVDQLKITKCGIQNCLSNMNWNPIFICITFTYFFLPLDFCFTHERNY